jgi:hypothetical protein
MKTHSCFHVHLNFNLLNLQDASLLHAIFHSMVTGHQNKLKSLGHPIAQAVSRWPGFMCDLWWTKWRWGRISPSASVSPANLHSTNFSTITITYHPGLVQ